MWATTLHRIRFYGSVTILNIVTLLLIANAFKPVHLWLGNQSVQTVQAATLPEVRPSVPEKKIISGKPVRIVVPSVEVDLPVHDGFYNPADGSWTLSEEPRAYYATLTPVPNDFAGNSLIYGHNNWKVFYKLTNMTPGAKAYVHTENGHIFSYTFKKSENLKPDNVSIFAYRGEPMLTLQTCVGTWYELRQMFEFTLDGVDL